MSRAALYKSAGIFALAATVGGLLLAQADMLERAERRRAAVELASAAAFALEQQLSRSLTAPYALAAVVRHAGGLRDFDTIAAELLAVYDGIDSLQAAPGGVLTHIYPLAGNEAALGLDLFADPVHRPGVQAAVESRRAVLVGPFRLRQGGQGLAGRVAVFFGAPGAERFWGIASAVIRLPRLLQASRLGRLTDAGYAYRLTGAASAGEAVIAASGTFPDGARPVSITVSVPNGLWVLQVVPSGGWRTPWRTAVAILAVLLAALALALLAYRVLRQPEVLRRQVAARTAELERAHRDQRRAEEALRHAQKLEAIGQLAGGVAHDFNNLLAGILGYAELIQKDAAPGSLVEEAGRTIVQAARRAADLTSQLLAFARMGKHRAVSVDVHEVAREVAKLLGRTIDKRITVELRLEAPRPFVLGDPTQVQQVVLNLAVNARDAMPDGGTPTIATSVEDLDELSARTYASAGAGRFLLVTVADTGVGIPDAIRDRIFEPFFTTKEEGKGTGMGLATAYGILRNHGGGIRMHTEEGRGTRFVVYLPLYGEAPVEAPRAPASPRGTGRVLVIDDADLVRQVAARMLAALGSEPVLAAGPQEAIDWMAAHPGGADVALIDLVMPGMDGFTCFERLRATDPGLRVVVSSGFARDGRAQAMLDAGALAFVQKPYLESELAEALAQALAVPEPRSVRTGS